MPQSSRIIVTRWASCFHRAMSSLLGAWAEAAVPATRHTREQATASVFIGVEGKRHTEDEAGADTLQGVLDRGDEEPRWSLNGNGRRVAFRRENRGRDRKSTRLNSSHPSISYA